MIVKMQNKKSKVSGYEKYFMFEAEDEEPPKNTKIIKVRPYDNRRTDYTKFVPDPDNPDGEEGQENAPEENQTNTAAQTDTPAEDAAQTTENPNGEQATDTAEATPGENQTDNAQADTAPTDDAEPVNTDDATVDTNTDDTDYTAGDDNGETDDAEPVNTDDATVDTNTDDTDYTAGDDNGKTDDARDANTDDTDYTADGDDPDTEDDDTDNQADGETDQQNDGDIPVDDKDHKYILFKKYIDLQGVLANYIQKLSGLISDNVECNHIYKKITNNLKELDEMLHDYMTIKYESATYVQSMLFYQRILVSIGINLDMLKGIRKKDLKMSEKKSKH